MWAKYTCVLDHAMHRNLSLDEILSKAQADPKAD